jgi:hypothetical protein
MGQKKKPAPHGRAWLLGLGLDNKDGHTRITKGDNFALFGGSEKTHSEMQEQAVKMNERLKRRGKTLDTVSREEFLDIAHELKMPIGLPKPSERRALPPAAQPEHEE